MGEMDPAADLEVMMLAMKLFRTLGYKGLTFQLNSTGCPTCKPGYVTALKRYLAGHEDELAPIDQQRLQRNALRVLDSKELGMQEILAGAPHIIDHLCDDCATHFADLRSLLDALRQPYSINFRLVRGIDYYTKTVFEVWAEGIGAQAAVCGGGRYDGLSEAIGGPATPGVGFGSGIERIVLGLKQQEIFPPQPVEPPILVAHFGGSTKEAAVEIVYSLRDAGIGARLAFTRTRRSMKSQMREGNRHNVKYMLIVGESELQVGEVTVRPMAGGTQTSVPLGDIVDWLAQQ
jgi:histidyl-tRNA synthetase